MTWQVWCCTSGCDHVFEFDKPLWDFPDLTCPKCGVDQETHVDEDGDMNYWFITEPKAPT